MGDKEFLETIIEYRYCNSYLELYDENYPVIFKRIKDLIINMIPNVTMIEHIGGTAILGIKSKPIIDILIPCQRKEFEEILNGLENIGFQKTPFINIPEDRPMKVGGIYYKNKFYNIHVHLTPKNSDVYFDNIFFREQIKNNKNLAKEYESLKEKAIIEGKIEATVYNLVKHGFIQSVIKHRIK